LELDADERVSDALRHQLEEALGRAEYSFYYVPFHNYIGAVWVKHGWGAYNGVAAKPCLFRKGIKSWGAGEIHPARRFLTFSFESERSSKPLAGQTRHRTLAGRIAQRHALGISNAPAGFNAMRPRALLSIEPAYARLIRRRTCILHARLGM